MRPIDRHGVCPCDYNPDTTNGPDEFCPHHGRPYTDLVDIIVRQDEEIGRLHHELHIAKAELVEDFHGIVKGLDG